MSGLSTVRELAADAGAPATHVGRSGRHFVIRACRDVGELDQCIALQQETWGYGDLETVPRNLYVLAQALGGHVLTAWDEQGTLAAYAMAMAALEPGDGALRGQWMQPVGASGPAEEAAGDRHERAPRPYLHSHMVAVAGVYQNEGLGFAMKMAQRAEALSRGIRRMRWTFDPTMARNAYFNLQRLGATVHVYVPNFYGLVGSRLQAGLPTDRLLAHWELDGPRVQQAVERRLPREEPVARIALSPQIAARKAVGDTAGAVEAQALLRAALVAAFARGLEICGFAADGEGGEYLLRRR